MKVTREKTENSQVYLTIELEPAEVEQALETAYRRLVKKTNIPGFRKGKAPRAVLERHLGKDSLLDDALNTLVPEAYDNAIREEEIEAIAQPHIEITQTDPLIFKAIVPLQPTVELGDYRQTRASQEPVEITEEDINKVIEQLRHQQATWQPVERPVKLGDLVVIDIESSVDDQPYINRKGTQFQLVEEAVFPAPGFNQQLVGAKADEEREFELEFPEDYSRAELAGKKASFKVKVTEIKEEILPELNDEFARNVNEEFESLDKLHEKLAENLRLNAEDKARNELEEKVIQAAVAVAKVEFPPFLVEMEIDRLINQQLQQWQMADRMEDYLRIINKTEEELREQIRPLARERVTSSLVLGRITEEEKIEAGDADIDAEIERITTGAAENNEELGTLLKNPQSREAIRRSLLARKTVERLVEIAGQPEEEVAGTGGD